MSFIDANGATVKVGDIVEYQYEPGLFQVESIEQDGDAAIRRVGQREVLAVRWVRLARVRDGVKATLEKQPLPVHGYTSQSDEKIALVNGFKQDEERLLRKLDDLQRPVDMKRSNSEDVNIIKSLPVVDQRWVSIARTHFQEGFMALNRAVFQPQRIRLPEDDE